MDEPVAAAADVDDLGFANACRLAGEFLYRFALVEQEIDRGIGIILGLDPAQRDIVTANMAFAKKVGALRSAEIHHSQLPTKERSKFVETTLSAVMKLNEDRVVVAHSPFEACGDGVVFHRTTATHGLKRSEQLWTGQQFDEWFRRAEAIRENVARVVDEIAPYEPSFDFSDPRNSIMAAFV